MKSHARLPALDGLRAVSILLVAFSHLLLLMGIGVIPGGFGVTVFFFISGFIITRLLLQESTDTGRVRLAAFYVRRVFRLAPALLAYVGISVAVLSMLGLNIPGSDVAATLLYYANYHAIYNGFTVTGGEGVFSPLAITWSLAIEEHFYFLFPICLVMLRKKTDRLLVALGIFVALVTVWRIYLVFYIGLDNLPTYRIYMGTDTRLDSIAYGCLLAVLFQRAEIHNDVRAKRLLDRLQTTAGLWAAGALIAVSFASRSPEFRETVRYAIQGLALVPLFCALFWTDSAPGWLKATLQNRAMVFFGQISYSLYLYHFLGLAVTQRAFRDVAPIGQVALAWCMAIAGSLISYYVIEGPARKFGAQIVARLPPYFATVGRVTNQ
jgi:peptidoglycan/LPS O-acetylase OafA/YrhL